MVIQLRIFKHSTITYTALAFYSDIQKLIVGVNQCKQYNTEKDFIEPLLKGLISGTCFPSIAPTQFGNCHFSSNCFAGRGIYSSIKLSIIKKWHSKNGMVEKRPPGRDPWIIFAVIGQKNERIHLLVILFVNLSEIC